MRIAFLVIAILAAGCLPPARAAPNDCPNGLFDIQAMVTRISPPDARLDRRRADGTLQKRTVVSGSAICGGETLIFPNDATAVELYEAGKIVRREAVKGPYTVPTGARAISSALKAYITLVMDVPDRLGAPPPRPNL